MKYGLLPVSFIEKQKFADINVKKELVSNNTIREVIGTRTNGTIGSTITLDGWKQLMMMETKLELSTYHY